MNLLSHPNKFTEMDIDGHSIIQRGHPAGSSAVIASNSASVDSAGTSMKPENAKRHKPKRQLSLEGRSIREEWWAALGPEDRLKPPLESRKAIVKMIQEHDPWYDLVTHRGWHRHRIKSERDLEPRQEPAPLEDPRFRHIDPGVRRAISLLLLVIPNPLPVMKHTWANRLGLSMADADGYIAFLQQDHGQLDTGYQATVQTSAFSTALEQGRMHHGLVAQYLDGTIAYRGHGAASAEVAAPTIAAGCIGVENNRVETARNSAVIGAAEAEENARAAAIVMDIIRSSQLSLSSEQVHSDEATINSVTESYTKPALVADLESTPTRPIVAGRGSEWEMMDIQSRKATDSVSASTNGANIPVTDDRADADTGLSVPTLNQPRPNPSCPTTPNAETQKTAISFLRMLAGLSKLGERIDDGLSAESRECGDSPSNTRFEASPRGNTYIPQSSHDYDLLKKRMQGWKARLDALKANFQT